MNYSNNEGVDRFEVEFGGNLSINERVIKSNGVIATMALWQKWSRNYPFIVLCLKE